MSTRARRWLVVGAALACALLSACADGRAWMEANAADSAAAEQSLGRGERDEAARHLRAIVEREVPRDVAEEDARVVRQDACERWARLEMERGDLEAARGAIERGLGLGEREDVFTANLLTTRGRIAEAEGRDRDAARDYHRALRIEEALLDRALGGSDE